MPAAEAQQVFLFRIKGWHMKFVDVIIDNKSENTDTFYTYRAPDEVEVGAKVTVPFARRKKPVDAYVMRINEKPSYDESKIKNISEYSEDRSLNQEMIDTAVWMRRRYGVKYIDAVKMFTTQGKREKAEKTIRSAEGEEPGYELTDEQKNAVAVINESIENESGDAFLIKGVTASGKTEVYMNAVSKALELGKNAIILLPEIALSDQVAVRFKKRFGEDAVASLHSKMTTSQRLEEWLRIRRGEVRIVVGARTAVFAPLDDIGIIVIDEEHEATFKSDHNPKYETVDVAYKRATQHRATLVLGSATPSVVTYQRAMDGIYKLIEMNKRAGDAELPELEIVDMRPEIRAGNMTCISRQLALEIDETLARNEQVILFLNRRGYSTQIMCMECGHKFVCDDCGIALTYHKSTNSCVCHYCGKGIPMPKKCPECGSEFIKYNGAGTEKIEETVRMLRTDATVDRFDLDTAKSQKEIDRVLKSFQKGKTNILVGTQILAKGLDFRNVGLVGIINADSSLNIPDFRSTERTFQLITQVAGRAGRTGGRSRVLIQTYDPESDVINDAAEGRYEAFFQNELLHRNIMNYPPYSDIIYVSFVEKDGASEGSAMKLATEFREYLKKLKDAPAEAVFLRPREDTRKYAGEKTRVSFVIKAPLKSRTGYMNAYMQMRDRMIRSKSDCYIEIDVNPYGMI